MDGKIPRMSLIFILLTVLGCILLIISATFFKDLNKQLYLTIFNKNGNIHSAIKPPEILRQLKVSKSYCQNFGKVPMTEDTKEEIYLLSYIAWPGPLVQGLPIKFSSHPAKSYFVIQGPEKQHIGDQLVVTVHVQNFLGMPKNHGGDLMIARLHSPKLGAGVAGIVQDHNDGNYTVLFPLLWAGEVWAEIIMLHPSEAIVVLKRLQEEQPDRIFYESTFRSGNLSENTSCKCCIPMNQQALCNFTDLLTGEPWYCYKPKKLGCDTRINHNKVGYAKDLITSYEAQFFQSDINLNVPIPVLGRNKLTVIPTKKGEVNVKKAYNTAGYYFYDAWRSLNGTVIRQFNNSSAIKQCLRGKLVYMLGDSTVRQWFEYLIDFVPDFKMLNLYSDKKSGPLMAVDTENNILLKYRCHGPPLRYKNLLTPEQHYVSNTIDRIPGGPDTVVLVSVWSHFSVGPIEVYIRRLQHIRKAVVRLLNREPATLVVIRTANLQRLSQRNSLFNSNWFGQQIDAVLRAMFRGLNVQMLDAWEMTVAHHLPHDIHPPQAIVKNMVNVVLSHICPV